MDRTELTASEQLAAAARAAGIDVDEMRERAADPSVIPDDEYEHQRQLLAAELRRSRGADCAECGGTIRANDGNVLVEVRGWHAPRTQGGQNHVVGRVETGRYMCGDCAIRMRAGLSPQQETLL